MDDTSIPQPGPDDEQHSTPPAADRSDGRLSDAAQPEVPSAPAPATPPVSPSDPAAGPDAAGPVLPPAVARAAELMDAVVAADRADAVRFAARCRALVAFDDAARAAPPVVGGAVVGV